MNVRTWRALACIFLFGCWMAAAPEPVMAQTADAPATPSTVGEWAERLQRFGAGIPQEKVFVHMDNTCYFLGDTIWYAAYTRRTDKHIPSGISRVLYAELYNQDGYLVERQMVEMKGGRGHGCFALPDTLYSGYYELRAYTRWQLNWGLTQHPHTTYAEKWFFNKAMAKEYYRDYDKLYSRVFPVYDKPKQPGEYFHDMTTRPLRRSYKEDAEGKELLISFFPEGGHLVGGAECHLAFEATDDRGEWMQGTMKLYDASETLLAQSVSVHRGRGVLTFTPQVGQRYHAVFEAEDGRTAEARVEKVPADGVALHVERKDDMWDVSVHAMGTASQRELGVTMMYEGVMEHFEPLALGADVQHFTYPNGELSPGVHQLTVFDADGRVWADRLFFVSSASLQQPSLTVTGLKSQYQPCEEVTLEIGRAQEAPATISLAIRDATRQDYTYDNGSILTEMLLASEIKGFVPRPQEFFEADDEEHRAALDLLMMTQGWRRFDWHTMATPKAFALNHPAETQTQILSGVVHKYTAVRKKDEIFDEVMADHEKFMSAAPEDLETQWENQDAAAEGEKFSLSPDEVFEQVVENSKKDIMRESQFSTGGMAAGRFFADEGKLKHEVRVHAEFFQGERDGILGDVVTEKGRFKMQLPHFYEACVLFLAASDTTHWKGGIEPKWVSMNEEEYPEFYVRLSFPYPRFVKPYSFYQMKLAATPKGQLLEPDFAMDAGTLMQTVTVKGRRRGLRRFDATKPAFVLDAYEAFNAAADAGFNTAWYKGYKDFIVEIARTYIGDMNMERSYRIERRYNTRNSTFYHSPTQLNHYNNLYNIDKVYVYTDYSPRREGLKSFEQDNQPVVTIDLRRPEDEGMRVTYRDRRYILQGFSAPDDFYHPDYRLHPLPESQKDYRRTLYWEPNLQLDEKGCAKVHFFTGSRPVSLTVEANGQDNHGILLTN